MEQTFTEAQGKDMYTSNALVTSVTEDGDKVKATLMFYMEEHDSFYTRNVKLTQSEADSKGIVHCCHCAFIQLAHTLTEPGFVYGAYLLQKNDTIPVEPHALG